MSETTQNIINNLTWVQQRIEKACEHSRRNPKEVKLLLATKTDSVEKIKIALLEGYTLIAENKVQELKDKYVSLKMVTHTNHFIGHLQTNKIKDLLKYDVSCIESIDNINLATKLHNRLLLEQKTIDVFIQINTSFEESKFGVEPAKAIE